jgi:predicted  nucleic acid-binding Zn-ribbon protein
MNRTPRHPLQEPNQEEVGRRIARAKQRITEEEEVLVAIQSKEDKLLKAAEDILKALESMEKRLSDLERKVQPNRQKKP